jgi:hypothetical protein
MNSGAAQPDHHPTHPNPPMHTAQPGGTPMTSHDALVQARLDDFQTYADANAARHERELDAVTADATETASRDGRDPLRVRLGRRLVEIGTAVAGEPVRPDRGRVA